MNKITNEQEQFKKEVKEQFNSLVDKLNEYSDIANAFSKRVTVAFEHLEDKISRDTNAINGALHHQDKINDDVLEIILEFQKQFTFLKTSLVVVWVIQLIIIWLML